MEKSLLSMYADSAKKFPNLSHKEVCELSNKVRNENDKEAFKSLVCCNARLVVKLAYRYTSLGYNLLDLIQQGNLGLLIAARKFDPSKGFRFSTYAACWIKAYMTKFIINNWSLVKLGTTNEQRALFFAVHRERFHTTEMREATDAEIAQRLNVKEEDIRPVEVQTATMGNQSLNSFIDDSCTTFQDNLSYDDVLPDDFNNRKDKINKIRNIVMDNVRDDIEKSIVNDRLLSPDPTTLQELGDRFGKSRERIRQIEKILLERFKCAISKDPEIMAA